MATPVGQRIMLPRRANGRIWTPDRQVVVPGPNPPSSNAGIIDSIMGARVPNFWSNFSTPADPVITSEAVVTPATAAASLATTGRRTILSPGVYGSPVLSGNDMEVVVMPGVEITGRVRLRGVRIRIMAADGAARQHRVNCVGIDPWNAPATSRTDYMLLNLNMLSGEGTQDTHQNQLPVQRLGVVGCYIDSVGFGLWIQAAGLGHDIFVGNTHMYQRRSANPPPSPSLTNTTQATLRIDGFERLVIVDSRLRNQNDDPAGNTRQHLRMHAQAGPSRDVYVSNNEFIGTSMVLSPRRAAGSIFTMTNVYIAGNRHYPVLVPGQTVNQIGTDPSERATSVTWINETIYSNSGNTLSTDPSWDTGNNVVVPFTSIPEWSFA